MPIDVVLHDDTDESAEGDSVEDKSSEESISSQEPASEDEPEAIIGVSFGEAEEDKEEEDEGPAPKWVKDVRRDNREKAKEIRELKAQLASVQPKKAEPQLPSKPTLAEYEYDEDRYNEAVEKWIEAKAKVSEVERKQREIEEKSASEWQAKVKNYTDSKAKLKVDDFEDAEDVVHRTLSDAQKSIIIDAADNPALLVYALGKNPDKVKELAGISSLARFAAQLAKLEAQLHTKKKSTPAPERRVTSSLSSVSLSRDIDRLASEATKSGDVTSLLNAMRSKQKGK